MVSTGLPNKDSADLHLVEATQQEILAQQNANAVEWQGALNLEQYLRREAHTSNQDLTRDGGMTFWMLVHQPDFPNGPRQVLCGCETMKKRAIAATNGEVEDVSCHGVFSVFCPNEFRGKGYSGRMINDLGKKLASWQVEQDGKRALFSVLYSDIGKNFYSARGWQVFASSEVKLPSKASSEPLPAGVRLLHSEDLPELCALDEKILRSRLASSQGTTVALIPDSRTIAWHHAREEFVAQELYGKKPVVKGAVVGKQGQRIWIYWTRVWADPAEPAPSTLHILRLAFEDETWSDYAAASPEGLAGIKDSGTVLGIAALFAVAQAEAARWDMKEVLLWNPSAAALAAAQMISKDAKVVHRGEESITSLRWYGDGSWEKIKWEANEKYGWC